MKDALRNTIDQRTSTEFPLDSKTMFLDTVILMKISKSNFVINYNRSISCLIYYFEVLDSRINIVREEGKSYELLKVALKGFKL